jgi:hypothetical protein
MPRIASSMGSVTDSVLASAAGEVSVFVFMFLPLDRSEPSAVSYQQSAKERRSTLACLLKAEG